MNPIDLPEPAVVDFRVSSYFSREWIWAAWVFLVFGAIILLVNLVFGIIMVIGGVLVITTQYRIAIDLANKTYFDYVRVFGIKNGESGKFESIQYVYITKTKVSQTLASRATQTSFVRDEYNGYLKFSEDKKIHLRSDASKERLTNAMQHIAMRLNCQLVDYSID